MTDSDTPKRTFNATRGGAPNPASARLRAFTLVELLVVIVIISLLVAILGPSIQVAVEQGRRTKCSSRLQNLHKAAAAYAGANRNLVPVVHDGTGYGATGRILARGGRFAEDYIKQSWEQSGASYANMLTDDNVFQCPAALDHWDHFDKKLGTNYRLSGFGLYTGAGVGLRPSTMKIVGTVQSKVGKIHPFGEVAMAMDWIWSRNGSGLSGSFASGMSLANHARGANVLYGSGAVKWVDYESMITIPSVDGLIAPPGTYGFFDGGTTGTRIYAPDGEVLPTTGVGDRKPGMGVMW